MCLGVSLIRRSVRIRCRQGAIRYALRGEKSISAFLCGAFSPASGTTINDCGPSASSGNVGPHILSRAPAQFTADNGTPGVHISSVPFLDQYGHPENPADLPKFATVTSIDDIFDDGARWNLKNRDNRAQQIELKPRLVTSDLRVRLQAAIHGIGIALLPEQVVSAPLKEGLIERVLSEWSGAKNILHLVYPTPREMLPSVRSLIDYLMIHVPAWLEERSI
jgi:DNA-binding transcriptional LysR family regulator